jgi:hypothetical protein
MNQNTIRAACASIFLTALAGCSSSPNEADVRAALIKHADASGGMFAQDYKAAFAKVKLVGCAKAEAGGYKCDISNTAGSVASMRFVKADGAWAVVNER